MIQGGEIWLDCLYIWDQQYADRDWKGVKWEKRNQSFWLEQLVKWYFLKWEGWKSNMFGERVGSHGGSNLT